MSKLSLDNITNISNPSAITTINNNSTSIEEAVENTLSRDGTSPNQMGSNLDMNSYHILNLPFPDQDSEPVRKGDVASLYLPPDGVLLGNAASKNVGTTIGTVAAGDDPRFSNTVIWGDGLSITGSTAKVNTASGITVSSDNVILDTTSPRNVDHSAVSILAGTGLTGGGTIESDQTLAIAFKNTSTFSGAVRTSPGGDLTLHVDGANGSDSNDGLTQATAVQTILRAYTILRKCYNTGGVNSNIQLYPATYSEKVFISAKEFLGELRIKGNYSDPTGYIIQGDGTGSGAAIEVTNGAVVTVGGLYLKCSNGGGCINTYSGGIATIEALTTMEPGLGNVGLYAQAGGHIDVQNRINFVNSCNYFMYANSGKIRFIANATPVFVSGNPTVVSSVAAVNTGTIDINTVASPWTVTGTVTGIRYKVENNGVINTNAGIGSVPNYFPGTVSGTTARGGVYVG